MDSSASPRPGGSSPPTPPDPADAALVDAVTDDEHADLDLEALAEATGATRALLDAVNRAGLLLPHHVDPDGTARWSRADVEAVRAGMVLLDAGLPLGELLTLARDTDAAVDQIARSAVEAFLRFVRDPSHGSAPSAEEAGRRMVDAYQRMLPATERLVAHHLRRRLLTVATERVLAERSDGPDGGGTPA